jgi:hypothetical protein
VSRPVALAAITIVSAAPVAADPLRLRGDALAHTAAPTGLLVLEGSDRTRPWLDAEALVWLGAGDETEADALVVAVTLRDPDRRGSLRIGRQVVVAGALRPVHVDGGDAHVRAPGDLELQAFGGVPVAPAFGADAYDWVAGARVARRVGDGRVGVGWMQQRDAGALAVHEVAADAAWIPDAPYDAAVGAAWDLAGGALAKVVGSDSWRRRHSRVELFGSHRAPAHLLPATSLFTVLGDVDVTRAGAAARWRYAPRLDLRATAMARIADSVDPEAHGEARLALDDAWRSILALELRRQGELGDGWTGVRGAARVAVVDGWTAATELELVVPDEARGRGAVWPWGLVSVAWRPRPVWELAAAVEASASPEDRWRVDGLALISRRWEAP